MEAPAEKPRLRSLVAMVAAILVFLGIVAFVGLYVVPVLQTASVVEVPVPDMVGEEVTWSYWSAKPIGMIEAEERVKLLGGKRSAAQKLERYVKAPSFMASEKMTALCLLFSCDEDGLIPLSRLLVRSRGRLREDVCSALFIASFRDPRVAIPRGALGAVAEPRTSDDLPAIWRQILSTMREVQEQELTADALLTLSITEFELTRDREKLLREVQRSLTRASSPVVRQSALVCFRWLDRSPTTLRLVTSVLAGEKDAKVLGTALHVIGLWGTDARVSAEEVAKLLNHRDAEVRREAASTLGRMQARKAVGALRRALHSDPDQGVQRAARRALEKIKKAQQEKQAEDKRPVETPAKAE